MRFPCRIPEVLPLLALQAWAPAAVAADYFVPAAWPTLQGAIDDAAANAEPENRILLGESPLTGSFHIGPDFDGGHTLTIGPDIGAGRTRATLLAVAMNVPVLSMTGVMGTDTGHVTIEDLDILRRDSGSASDLVVVDAMAHVTLDRCRIGLDMQAPTSAGFANLRILYPIEVIVRNCLFFSAIPGGLDRAVDVQNMFDPASSVLLYDNLAADYRFHGFRVNDGGSNPAALVLLRNNVAINSMTVVPEPFGYRSEVDEATIVTSHNVVYASSGFEESRAAGAGSIGGGPTAFGISMPRVQAVASFVETTWRPTPPYDANPTFFRLQPAGPLHDASTDWGQTVLDGFPHARDVAVLLDCDRQGRPGGFPVAHTDRGPDQIEAAVATSATPLPSRRSADVLHVTADPNPFSRIRLRFTAKEAGRLTLEVFDLAGRRVAYEERTVGADEPESWSPASGSSGVAFYRATLRTPGGLAFTSTGKITLLR